MSAISNLDFPHRVVVLGDGHWRQVTVSATAPLTRDGILGFIRYEDEVATRFGAIASTWVTEDHLGRYAGVYLYSAPAHAPGSQLRRHPSSDSRCRGIGEAYAAPEGSARPVDDGYEVPLLWASLEPGEPPVPVSVTAGEAVRVGILGAGLLPQRTDLLLGDPGLPERLATSPTGVAAHVYACTYRTYAKVAARVAAGRARPTATLTIGTLAQLGTGGTG